ncbi:MAG: tRNA glutamyl-Q(34) synthetase GluQRS [Cocleimonas sp.]|nr:tRNA glutamyl-Q(34) synthetase GluQRS [Cocleimonas sp.]
MSDTLSSTSPTKTIGRFAPSPTGPLHFGSLIAATASYLSAKTKSGQWLLRIEDVDTQREQKGAAQSIISSLESYDFEWDGEIIYQSQRSKYYQDALDTLGELVYPCSCTRKSLMASTGSYSYIYPGFCREGMKNQDAKHHSIRILTDDKPVCFIDQCQVNNTESSSAEPVEAHPPTFTGSANNPQELCQNINKEVGDFILKRTDGLWAYQLAVVVDDALQGITEVVRGADLFDNTPRQIYLQRLLGYSQPSYLHFPVAVDDAGKKLSKQNLSPEISADQKRATLIFALAFLGQQPPNTNDFLSLNDVWQWALQNWDARNIPKVMTLPLSKEYLKAHPPTFT